MAKLLSKRERLYVEGKPRQDGHRFTPQERSNIRRSINDKIQQFVTDFILVCNSEKKMVRAWSLSNIPTSNELIVRLQHSLLNTQIDRGPAVHYSYRYRSSRNGKGQIVVWRESLRGSDPRQYRRAASKGDLWNPDFRFRGLKKRTVRLIKEASALQIGIPEIRLNAITILDLKQQIVVKKALGHL